MSQKQVFSKKGADAVWPSALEGLYTHAEALAVVIKQQKNQCSTTTETTEPATKNLFTHEEGLKLLAKVLNGLRKPIQDKLVLLQQLRILMDKRAHQSCQRLWKENCTVRKNSETEPLSYSIFLELMGIG